MGMAYPSTIHTIGLVKALMALDRYRDGCVTVMYSRLCAIKSDK